MTAVKESPVLVKLEAAAQRVDEINRLLSDPSVLGQTSEIQRLNKERAELIAQGELYHEFSALLKQIAETEDLREDPHPEVRDLARDELKQLQGRRAELESRAKALLTHKDPRDEKNTFIEVRAGTGGDEAGLFAVELVRMYTRYAERRRWRIEVIDSNITEIGGVKEAVLLVEGKGAYSRFKHESGVHRVQRVPATEASGRIHTSTITVAVLPEAEEVELQTGETFTPLAPRVRNPPVRIWSRRPTVCSPPVKCSTRSPFTCSTCTCSPTTTSISRFPPRRCGTCAPGLWRRKRRSRRAKSPSNANHKWAPASGARKSAPITFPRTV